MFGSSVTYIPSRFRFTEENRRDSGVNGSGKSGLAQFRALIEKYEMLRLQMTFSEIARSLVDELGILAAFKEERTAESMGRWENVQELLSAISEFSHEKQMQHSNYF